MSAAKPDHRTLPRKKRPPSQRDQALYLARRTRGWSQQKLAEEFDLSQVRVSQILRRVEQWRSGYGPRADGELDHAGRQRLERYLERERNQAIFDRAIREFDAAPQELKSSKRGERDGKQFSEESKRDLPPPVQMLKVALRASENLAKAADKPAPPPPRDPEEERRERERLAMDWLYAQRREAEEAGKVPKSREHQGDNYWYMATVEHRLGALVGEAPSWQASPIHFGPGTPLAELAKFYYPEAPAASNPSNAFNPILNGETQVEDPPQLADESADFEPAVSSCDPTGSGTAMASFQPQDRAVARTSEPGLVPPKNNDAADRRLRHMQKLEAWKEARRRRLPIQFEFDPADGPLPPRYYVVDGVDCS